jgi:hypothetical protein
MHPDLANPGVLDTSGSWSGFGSESLTARHGALVAVLQDCPARPLLKKGRGSNPGPHTRQYGTRSSGSSHLADIHTRNHKNHWDNG